MFAKSRWNVFPFGLAALLAVSVLSHEDNEMMRPYCIGDMTKCKP